MVSWLTRLFRHFSRLWRGQFKSFFWSKNVISFQNIHVLSMEQKFLRRSRVSFSSSWLRSFNSFYEMCFTHSWRYQNLIFSGTRALTYADGSITQYLFHLHKFVYDPRETKIQMQIRTRDPDGGVLMFNGGSEEGRFSLLEVANRNLNYTVNLLIFNVWN